MTLRRMFVVVAIVEALYAVIAIFTPTSLVALLGSFGAIVLLLSSADLRTYAAFPYGNGIIRLAWVAVTFALGFPTSIGVFAALLAAGDLSSRSAAW